jgi:hypothetical protein
MVTHKKPAVTFLHGVSYDNNNNNMPPLNQQPMFDSAHSTISADGDKKKSRVSFGDISVREYERIVGDHPDTKVGPPLSIGWAFIEHRPLDLDQYEEVRLRKGNRRMSSITRKNILHNVFQIPEEEIRMAEKEVQRIMKNREKTSKQGKVSEKTEEAVQSLGRKLRRSFSKDRGILKGFLESQRLMFPTMAY